MLGQTLEAVDHQPYLGVTLSESLNWKEHNLQVKNKANSSLGFIKRNFHSRPERVKRQAYFTLVRPILEYGSASWKPYRNYQINWFESVHAPFVTRTYSREEGCVTRALNRLNWQSLQHRSSEWKDRACFTKPYITELRSPFHPMSNTSPAPQLEISIRLNSSLSKLHVMLINSVSGKGQLTIGTLYHLIFKTLIRLTIITAKCKMNFVF